MTRGMPHDRASNILGYGPGMLKYGCTDRGVQLIMPRECVTDGKYCEGEVEFPSQISRSGVCRCRAQILLSERYTRLGRCTARFFLGSLGSCRGQPGEHVTRKMKGMMGNDSLGQLCADTIGFRTI